MKIIFVYFCKLIIFPITSLFIQKIEGNENIPKHNNFIVASNHISSLGHFFITIVLKKKLKDIRFIGAMDKLRIFLQSGLLYYLSGTIAINRKKDSREDILKRMVKSLKDGRIIVIYPEGEAYRKRELSKGRTGVAELALRTGFPILPIGIGSTGFLKKSIKIGKLIDFSEESKLAREIENDKGEYNLLLRKVTDKTMQKISELSGKEYSYKKI